MVSVHSKRGQYQQQRQLQPQRYNRGEEEASYYPQQHRHTLPHSTANSQYQAQWNMQNLNSNPRNNWSSAMNDAYASGVPQYSGNGAYEQYEQHRQTIAQFKSYIDAATSGMDKILSITILRSPSEGGGPAVQLKASHTGMRVTEWRKPHQFYAAHDAPLDCSSHPDPLAAIVLGPMIDTHFAIDYKLHKILQKFTSIRAFARTCELNSEKRAGDISADQWEAYWTEDHDIRILIAQLQNSQTGLLTKLCAKFNRFYVSVEGVLPPHSHLAAWLIYIQDFCENVTTTLEYVLERLNDRFRTSLQENVAAQIAGRLSQSNNWRGDVTRCIKAHLEQPSVQQPATAYYRKYWADPNHEWREPAHSPLDWLVPEITYKFQDYSSNSVGFDAEKFVSQTRISYRGLTKDELRRAKVLRQRARPQSPPPLPQLALSAPVHLATNGSQPTRKRKCEDESPDAPPAKKAALDHESDTIFSAASSSSASSSPAHSANPELTKSSNVQATPTSLRDPTVVDVTLVTSKLPLARNSAAPLPKHPTKSVSTDFTSPTQPHQHATANRIQDGLSDHTNNGGTKFVAKTLSPALKRPRSDESSEAEDLFHAQKFVKIGKALDEKKARGKHEDVIDSIEVPVQPPTKSEPTEDNGPRRPHESSGSPPKVSYEVEEISWNNIPGLQNPKQGTPGTPSTPDSGYDSLRSSLQGDVAGATSEPHMMPPSHLNTADSGLLSSPSAFEPGKDSTLLVPLLSSVPPVAPEEDEEEL